MPDRVRHGIPSHAVDRPALRARLDAGVASPLSLIVAPAGAGKTLLLAQWVQSRPDLHVAWLDIAAADGHAAAFSRRLSTAIWASAPGFHPPHARVDGTSNRLGELLIEEFATGLADAGPLVVIFDDLDQFSGNPLLTDLWRLVDLLPPTGHFVFASRVDLELGWSRHRLQHNLIEIRQRELAFDRDSTAHVIRSITGRRVSDETVDAVVARTEGWAVGVQLTALGLRFADDPKHLVDTLTDTDRLVVDYLSEEVLEAQPPERRAALMSAAVLDEFCAPLLDAILGAGGAALIAGLERDSMFVVPVPRRPGWFRFHRLFRELLLLRVRAQDAPAETRALVAAAEWAESEDHLAQAIEYHLRAHAWDRALDAVLALGRHVYEDGMPQVAGWLMRLPREGLSRRNESALLLAIAHALSGHGTVAVDSFRVMLAERRLTTGQRQIALTYLAACVDFAPHAEYFADVAQRALDLLAAEQSAVVPDLLGLTSRPVLLMVARASLGRARLLLGDLAGARDSLQAALVGEDMAYRPFRVHALGALALTEAFAGRLALAGELADTALVLAEEFGFLAHLAPAEAFLARAVAAIRRGDADVGALALAEGTARAASSDSSQRLWLAHLAALIIDSSGSETVIPAPPGPPPPFVSQMAKALALRSARFEGAPVLPTTHASTWSLVAFEEIAALLALGQPAAARLRLTQLAFEADPRAPMHTIERDLLLGWTCALEGHGAESRTHVQAALDLAAPERLLYPFMEAGVDVSRLIETLPGPGDEFRRLAVLRGRVGAASRKQSLVDGLTPRELELLAYLPSRLTFADIAARSFVSVNTVKTHVGHIYRKLGVTGRDAAIERAVELGLIDAREVARDG